MRKMFELHKSQVWMAKIFSIMITCYFKMAEMFSAFLPFSLHVDGGEQGNQEALIEHRMLKG